MFLNMFNFPSLGNYFNAWKLNFKITQFCREFKMAQGEPDLIPSIDLTNLQPYMEKFPLKGIKNVDEQSLSTKGHQQNV